MIVNPNSFWLLFKDACRKKKVTKDAMRKAIEQGKITAHEVICPNKKVIFVEIDKKYKEFTSTSLLKIDLNGLIRFTNAKSKKRNTILRPDKSTR